MDRKRLKYRIKMTEQRSCRRDLKTKQDQAGCDATHHQGEPTYFCVRSKYSISCSSTLKSTGLIRIRSAIDLSPSVCRPAAPVSMIVGGLK